MKYLELDNESKYITFRDINDYKEGCIEVPDDFQEPPDIFNYRLNINTLLWELIPVSEPSLQEIKQMKLAEIQSAFQQEMNNGYIEFIIPSSNTSVLVDARRSGDKNDLQNVEGLIELAQLGFLQSPVLYKCYDNNKYEFTLQDLQALKIALMAKGLLLYSKKHYLEDLVAQAQTKEEVEAIRW